MIEELAHRYSLDPEAIFYAWTWSKIMDCWDSWQSKLEKQNKLMEAARRGM